MSQTQLLGGDDWRTVAARAATRLPQVQARLAILADRAGEPPLADLLLALRTRSTSFQTLTPPSALAGWLSARSREWVEVELQGRGDRLARATMPKALTEAGSIVAITDLTSFNSRRPVIAIGLWAQFAHPRQRLGAAWSDQATGLAAEIALAAPLATYLIAASWRGKPMLVVADDMIAAELAGLAIGQAQADPDHELIGPWEQPLVQRAGELGLGVRLPAEIEFLAEWLGADEAQGAAFKQFAAALATRLGIPPPD